MREARDRQGLSRRTSPLSEANLRTARAEAANLEGNVAQLPGKAIDEKGLDVELTAEDLDRLQEALPGWGMLDHGMRYARGPGSDAPARA